MFRSLTVRALALAALTTGGALIFLWVLLTGLFEQRISQRYFAEIEVHLDQLARAVEPGPEGIVLSDEPDNSAFERPLSGLYWQIEDGDAALTSNSLWDEFLDLPPPGATGQIRRHPRIRFGDGTVMAVERTLVVGEGAGERPVRMIVAIDRTELEQTNAEFADRVLVLVALLGGFLLLATAAQVFFGLRPLKTLRNRLNAVRAGQAGRLEGRFPTEITGLADELNRLLAAREEMIARARARAGDLAHGLKTPLAVLAAEARRLEAEGEAAAAAEITQQIERMHRNVERELVRARAAGAGATRAARTHLGPAVERLVKAFRRMPRGADLAWDDQIGPDLAIAMDPADFDEVAGTLLDNARKWAKTRVVITAGSDGVRTSVTVQDDGPGVPDAELGRIVERGWRLDEATPGTGLGLAIAKDILELYGGRLRLDRGDLGGLSATMTVPVAGGGQGPLPPA